MDDEQRLEPDDILQQVVNIVSAYVSHNSMRASDLPEFIGQVHSSLRHLGTGVPAVEAKPAEAPAVPVKRSVNREYIVCLEDGKKFKSLRRHLSSFHQLTPDEYRTKWGLPSDYPMVAPAYSATRSQLAKESGLGQLGRAQESDAPENDAESDNPAPSPSGEGEDAPKKAKRGRPRKNPV